MIAPSAVAAAGEMYTDAEGLKPFPLPEAMTLEDISAAVAEYAQAASNAVAAQANDKAAQANERAANRSR